MDKENLINIIDSLGFESRSYSGRGMYGKQCVGVTCSNPIEMIVSICQELNEHEYDDFEFLKESKTDSMGMEQILYFPNISW